MSYMVVLIADDVDDVPPVLKAWEAAGILGTTVLESTGPGRIHRAGLRDDLPLMPSLQDLLENEEIHHRTLFAVVETQEEVDRMVAAVERVIGDLNQPHTGFMFVLPVLQVYGFGKHRTDRRNE